MRSNVHPSIMPGGWTLIDDSCLQYVRRLSPRSFELIEYGRYGPEGQYEVYTDTICLQDYEAAEIQNIIKGFGYSGISDLRDAYHGSYDTANQVIAECIFEHFGSFSAISLCVDVDENEARKAVMEFVSRNNTPAELQDRIELSFDALAESIRRLGYGEEMTFYAEEDGDAYGITRIRQFDADMMIINNYGGARPLVIDTEWDAEGDRKEIILDSFRRYCACWGIEAIFVDEAKKQSRRPPNPRQTTAMLGNWPASTIPAAQSYPYCSDF